jgi:hypothetical protein
VSTVEVLAPLRIETRFVAPADRTDGVNEWMLRLRIYPDEFSIRRRVPPPSPEELDRLEESIEKISSALPDEADAFASFAGAVGASRALALWRTCVTSDGLGHRSVDRTGEAPHQNFSVHGPAGMPATLEVWFVHTNGTRELATTLTPNLVEIGKDLDLETVFAGSPALAAGTLPETWWLSYARAKDLQLAADIDIGTTPPALDALVVLGIGDEDAAGLVDAHNAGGRMGVLAPGTPTNTVAGEPTTDLGENAETIAPLLHVNPGDQMSTRGILAGLTGRLPPTALPMPGGGLDYLAASMLAVQGLWPVLWGRVLRDVIGIGETEAALARWARWHLAVEGPRPAFRVGEQPYGLLPTTSFNSWVDAASDDLAPIEARIREWALPWRAKAAEAARIGRGRVHGADMEGLVDALGVHAPTRYWNARATADLYDLQALRMALGMQPLDTGWDDNTARALRGVASPLAPIGRAPGEVPLPGPPRDAVEDVALLKQLPGMEPAALLEFRRRELGLVGHLMREALINARAIIGEAAIRVAVGQAIDAARPLTWSDENAYRQLVLAGKNQAVADLRNGPDANGVLLATRFKGVQDALQVIADLWEKMATTLFRGVLAALDTAAFRVDPWLTGIAERRLQRMIATEAPFKLGAYGWVDSPAPYTGAPGGPLAPGPTRAGLLHTPSAAQALTAALLRDAAVRYPGDTRWKLNLDSAKVRAALALAERVRLGVHPYEGLGLEVEKIVGDWDAVRVLRKTYALAADQQERRVCDGQKVLQAAREGALPADPALRPTLATELAALDDVLDTYADLLVTDGIYALVTGRADLANAAMEAAAGLGAPPELRAVRTPREATTVRVSAWVLLEDATASGGVDADPARIADPSFAAAVDAELGAGAFESVDDDSLERRSRFASVLGGAESDAPVPALTGGGYEGLTSSADADLRQAIAGNLHLRLTDVVNRAKTARDTLAPLDPDGASAEGTLAVAASRWRIELEQVASSDPESEEASTGDRHTAVVAALNERIAEAESVVAAGSGGANPSDEVINGFKRAIRSVVGRPELPVLPIVPQSLLPTLRGHADLDRAWLEIVAAVRPRLAPLEARQLDRAQTIWPGAVAAPNGSTDPWQSTGSVVVAYGSGVEASGSSVAIAAIDAWTDSIPSRKHDTFAAFGFNAPKSRAPQAVLVVVPPDISKRLDNAGLLDVILETRELAHARAPRQAAEPTLPHPTSTALVSAETSRNFLDGWPA